MFGKVLYLGVLLWLAVVTTSSDAPIYFENALVTWDEAKDACRAMGMELVSISNSQENAAVVTARNGFEHTDNVWIGLNDKDQEGEFAWVDGTAVGYFNWASGEPSNLLNNTEDCVVLGPSGLWKDGDCSLLLPYLCSNSSTGTVAGDWVLGNPGAASCSGPRPSQDQCLLAARSVTPSGVVPGRTDLVIGSWPTLPTGCSVQSGGDWAAHFNLFASGIGDATYTPVCRGGPDCGRSIQYDADADIPLPSFVSSSQDALGALSFEVQVPEHYMPGYSLTLSQKTGNNAGGTVVPAWTSETCDAQGTYHNITQPWSYFYSNGLLEYVPGTLPGAPDYFVGEFQFDGDVNVTDKHQGRQGAIGPIRKQTTNLPFRVKFATSAFASTSTANASLLISSPIFNAAMILEQIQLVSGTGQDEATNGTARILIETSINPGFKVVSPTYSVPSSANNATVVISERTDGSYANKCRMFTDTELEDGSALPCFQYWEFLVTTDSGSPCDLSGIYSGEFSVDYHRDNGDDLIDISDQDKLTYSFTLEELCSIEIDDNSGALFSALMFQDPDQNNQETYEFFVGETVSFELVVLNPFADFSAATLTDFKLLEGNLDIMGGDPALEFSSSAALIDANGHATITGSFKLDDNTFTLVADLWDTVTIQAVTDVTYANGQSQQARHLLQLEGKQTSTEASISIVTVEEEEEEKDDESTGAQKQMSLALAIASTALLF